MSKINLQNFFSKNPKIKYSCAKQAVEISKNTPEELYPDLDFLLQFLDGENKILKWTAIIVIGNLSRVDKQKKVDALIPKLITFLPDKSMITAANTIQSLSVIAMNKPEHLDVILKELLKVEKAKYYSSKGEVSPECTNVAIGHVINSLSKFGELVLKRNEVIDFLKRQTKNTRIKVQKSAQLLLDNIK